MDREQLEAGILTRGREFFATLGNETPSIFKKDWWTGKVMDWSMSHEDFKIQLFRFIDVLPCLTTGEMLNHHIQEYFSQDENVPAVLRFGAKSAGIGGRVGMKMLGKTIRKNLESMALQFIIGNTIPETVKNIERLRRKDFTFTLDILGEATVSEKEADLYADNYKRLLEGLEQAQPNWVAFGTANSALDWGYSPKVNISIKPSALYSQINPANFEGSVEHILDRLKPVYRRVIELNGFMCIDTEMRKYKEITFEVYRRLRSDSEFKYYPHLGLAMQVYLKSSDQDIDHMLEWARQQHLPISIRLVKGAYWDYEIVIARQSGWPIPVYTNKAETDAAFERSAEKILRNHDFCHLACASHNVRSMCSVMELGSRQPPGKGLRHSGRRSRRGGGRDLVNNACRIRDVGKWQVWSGLSHRPIFHHGHSHRSFDLVRSGRFHPTLVQRARSNKIVRHHQGTENARGVADIHCDFNSLLRLLGIGFPHALRHRSLWNDRCFWGRNCRCENVAQTHTRSRGGIPGR
jgi:RHH-type proline utilization regulon transcriptional repressor/proline dehydrogenase/delta 1-pyrroline-5-carboxylate dehydrogenase